MKFVSVYKPKTVFLTITLLTFGLFVMLNLMVVGLNGNDHNSPRHNALLVLREKSKNSEKADRSYSQGQRKPKATNLENTSQDEGNEVQDEVIPNLRKTGEQEVKTIEYQYHSYYGDEDEDDKYGDEEYEELRTEEEDENEDEGDEEVKNTNPVFKPGDFGDIRGLEYFKKPQLKYEVPKDTILPLKARVSTEDYNSGMSSVLIQNGMYWSTYAESLVPKGLSYRNVTKLLRSLRSKNVQYLKAPSWKRCGRPKNGFVEMFDGTEMCARYRHPHMSLVFGEVLSFYLSRLLSMDNVPAVVLSRVNSLSPQWQATNISRLGWEENQLVALIHWVPDIDALMSEIKIPKLLLQAYQSGLPVTKTTIQSSSLHSTEISELVQWGTMIVFDYLTANYDRVASMQDAAEKENKPSIIQEPIRNLRKSSKTKKLWLIDNESGLLDAYELLNDQHSKGRFHRFHKEMLQTMCIFQSSLVNAVNNLHSVPSPHKRLENFAKSHEPLLKYMLHDETYHLFETLFSQRLKDVVDWINHCKVLNNR